jgi:hypothetical protein
MYWHLQMASFQILQTLNMFTLCCSSRQYDIYELKTLRTVRDGSHQGCVPAGRWGISYEVVPHDAARCAYNQSSTEVQLRPNPHA